MDAQQPFFRARRAIAEMCGLQFKLSRPFFLELSFEKRESLCARSMARSQSSFAISAALRNNAMMLRRAESSATILASD